MMDFENEKNITIFTHPLIQHKISILRDKKTGTNEFRKLVEEIAMLEGLRLYQTFQQKMLRLRHLLKLV
mgnify:CR=1 FL=1